jgi:hypothetical protein
VLVVLGEQLLHHALGAGVQRIPDDGDVALAGAGVGEVLVRLGVVDVPVLVNGGGLLVLVVERLDDLVVPLESLLVGQALGRVGPVALGIG